MLPKTKRTHRDRQFRSLIDASRSENCLIMASFPRLNLTSAAIQFDGRRRFNRNLPKWKDLDKNGNNARCSCVGTGIESVAISQNPEDGTRKNWKLSFSLPKRLAMAKQLFRFSRYSYYMCQTTNSISHFVSLFINILPTKNISYFMGLEQLALHRNRRIGFGFVLR